MPHMISTERKDRPKTREPGRFYIDELAFLLNRRSDTLRRWEGTARKPGPLPTHLHPRRGSRDWRYWTDSQVYGSRGIVKWMKTNDMRPGNFFTDYSQEENHIRRLRIPKNISEDVLEEIHKYSYQIKRGPRRGQWARSQEWIIRTYYPQSTYLTVENFLRAVQRYFAERGWPFPPPSPRVYKKRAQKSAASRKKNARVAKRQERENRRRFKKDPELVAIEREADRLIRITKSK